MRTNELVTQQIIKALETADAKGWQRPFVNNLSLPLSAGSGKPYRGINTLLLMTAAQRHGFESPYWLTSKMLKAYPDARVPENHWHRNGGPGKSLITFYGEAKRKPDADGKRESYRFLKWYSVWNASQVDGLPDKFYPAIVAPSVVTDLSAVDFAKACGPEVSLTGNVACYIPSADRIETPAPKFYHDQQAFDSTLYHETIHSTGHRTRLDRLSERNSFGSKGYAFEELVAEIGATFLCAALGKTYKLENHANYLANWLELLKDDSNAILRAAKLAQQAFEYCADAVAGTDAEFVGESITEHDKKANFVKRRTRYNLAS